MDDRLLALLEISNDLLYHKIPKSRLSYYIDRALQAGRDAAQEYPAPDLEALYRENGITVEYRDDGKSSFGIAYRGQITLSKEGCSLTLFRSSVTALAENSGHRGCAPLDYEQAKDIHLAHEFFHFLEHQHNGFVSQALDPVVSLRLLGFQRHAHINRCSEVAAHAFAKALLNLPVLPNYYDYVYLMNTGQMTPEAFEAMLLKYRQELCNADAALTS